MSQEVETNHMWSLGRKAKKANRRIAIMVVSADRCGEVEGSQFMTRVKSLVIPLIFVSDPAGIYTVLFREKAILLGGKNPDKIHDPTRPPPLFQY
jgi:hypothetical protein